MAKKGNAKGSGGCDYSITPEEKSKVQRLSDMFPEANKDHITIILRYYDFDSDKATDALTTDGGSSVLSEWNNSMENNQMKVTNKNKKKNKKKNRKDNGSILVSSVIDADDSSSLHSSNIDFDGERETISKLDEDGTVKLEQDSLSLCNSEVESSCDRPPLVDDNECNILSGDKIDTPEEAKSDDGLIASLDNDSVENSAAENIERLSPKDDMDEHSRHSSKHNSRQRHGSSRYSKSSSISEDHSSQSSKMELKNRNYDRSRKDLNRQSVSLQNIQFKVENKFEEASKSMKNAFNEIKELLDKRQMEIELEMERVKQEALNLLKSRQELGSELKVRVDRSSMAPDSEWFELKSDIKQFVGERKYDDQLGRTTWFCWSMDTITKEIGKFGEVAAVKHGYSQRSSQNQSISDLNQNELDAKTDNMQQVEAGLESSLLESGHEGRGGKVGRETSTKVNQSERNYRVFSNSNYGQQNNFRGFSNNRNRGYHSRGNTGGYNRGYYNNYRHYRGNDRHDFKQYSQDYHSMPSYEDRSAGDNLTANDGHNQTPPRFASNPRNARQQNRRSYGPRGPRNNFGPNRFNKSPRSVPDSTGGIESGDCTQLNQDKPNDTVNGYLEES